MAIDVWESSDSETMDRTNKDTSGSLRYWCTGTDSSDAVVVAVAAVAPLGVEVDGGFAIRSKISPKLIATETWEVKVDYADEDDEKSDETPEDGTWQFSFDTTGGDHEITQSISTVERYYRTSGNPAPDLRGAIGWDGKKLNGTKIVVPKLEFQIEAYYDSSVVDTTFAANLARATGKTNDAPWLNFEECEVLFMGSTGQGDKPTRRGQRVKPAKVVFKYACSENRDDIVVGEIALKSGGAGAATISKKGWEYLWVHYTKKDTVDGIVYPTPEWAYVEMVYRSANFAALFGIS